jgi:osmotically-inducible protein OsmY
MSTFSRGRALVLTLAVTIGLGQLVSACAPVMLAGAGATAGATAGVAATQERGAKVVLSDARIRDDINDLWFQKSRELYSSINLQVQEARVLLSGSVADPQNRVDAVRLVWQVKGVKEVINEIEIKDDSSLSDWFTDVKIGTELRNKLRFDKAVSSTNYSVEVVNQNVYLIGVAQDQAELDRVIAHAKDVQYVRRVVNYVRLKDDPARKS